jgi:formate hydrogenlyase subunit 3/multisubunit Na+/H+ antiporter MnhD subunit
MFLPRMIGLGLWALSLSVIQRAAGSTRFDAVHGLAQRLPFATAGLAVASLTLGGLPIFPVFPIHQVILEEIARHSLSSAIWTLIGSGAMLFSAFRALAELSGGTLLPQSRNETRLQMTLFIGGIAILLLVGLLPQVFLPMFRGMASGFAPLP